MVRVNSELLSMVTDLCSGAAGISLKLGLNIYGRFTAGLPGNILHLFLSFSPKEKNDSFHTVLPGVDTEVVITLGH